MASAVAEIDFYLSLAIVAVEKDYIRPKLRDDGLLHIIEGRHPVVEHLLEGEAFVPNDTEMDIENEQILIITGPNMSGKSTYLRQIGLIVLLAQIGSFVPAQEAKIGLVDRIFTRVGASDNLARGQSTFLTEMIETANILNNATPKSLILLDEIGRGTSTFDGLSIAWAVTEYLHNISSVAAKTLFATHYHELTELALILPRVSNYNVAVREWEDEVIFLRKIVKGGSDRSYGIYVARLAGLPIEVIERAKEILHNLEANELTVNHKPKLAEGKHAPNMENTSDDQLTFFAPVLEYREHPVVERLRKTKLNKLTPLEALNLLSEIKEELKK